VDESGERPAGTLQIAAELKNLSTIGRFVEDNARTLGAGQECIADLIQAVDEAATNVIMHGYRNTPGPLELEAGREGEQLVIILRDQAPPFDPTTAPPPDLTTPLHERRMGGLGVHLMRALTDSLAYRARPGGGNELVMAKHC
jgi:serine/threonine-protein kinase RsbW